MLRQPASRARGPAYAHWRSEQPRWHCDLSTTIQAAHRWRPCCKFSGPPAGNGIPLDKTAGLGSEKPLNSSQNNILIRPEVTCRLATDDFGGRLQTWDL